MKPIFHIFVLAFVIFACACDPETSDDGLDAGANDAGNQVDASNQVDTGNQVDVGQVDAGVNTGNTETVCNDDCGVTDDECDDGGDGSETDLCPLGTDCTDCGSRVVEACTPSCEGKECGSDGCRGSCGSCATGVCSSAGQCNELTVRLGEPCNSCDEIFNASGNCFQTGDAVIAECGGVSSGSAQEVPYCRRGPGDSAGYCAVRCTASLCPSGFICQDTGAGVDGCLR